MTSNFNPILSLGSNLGDRRQYLHAGLDRLRENGYRIDQVSPIVESPAQLPPNSPSRWNRPYLNLVVRGNTALDLESFLRLCKLIQTDLGAKDAHNRWAPRNLDIDVLVWGDEVVCADGKFFPDPREYLNAYVLSPLIHMCPDLRIPGGDSKTVFDLSCSQSNFFHIPLWMGILNITPDSFSDGGCHFDPDKVRLRAETMIEDGVNIIDIGAESTRPGATPLPHDEEWNRLQPALELVRDVCRSCLFAPQISIDTYHPETAYKALEQGVDIVNDVSGLTNEGMLEIARSSDSTFVAMHSVSVPADPNRRIEPESDPCGIFEAWLADRRKIWKEAGVDLSRIVVDPGIGFGKDGLQSLQLMRSAQQLRNHGHRLLFGHSRKSFLKTFAVRDSHELDSETVGASLQLCSKSVDILRVHDVGTHTRAYLSWAHLQDNLA